MKKGIKAGCEEHVQPKGTKADKANSTCVCTRHVPADQVKKRRGERGKAKPLTYPAHRGPDELISTAEFMSRVGRKRTWLYMQQKTDHSFPKPVYLNENGRRLWRFADVVAYIKSASTLNSSE